MAGERRARPRAAAIASWPRRARMFPYVRSARESNAARHVRWHRARLALTLGAFGLAAGCGGEGDGEPVRIHVPPGSVFAQVADSLEQRDIVDWAPLFRIYARMTGAAGDIKPGTYAFRPGTGWAQVLEDLRAGRVLTDRMVIPEGFDLRDIAPRVAELTGHAPDSVLNQLADSATANAFGVPGPTLEGYLYPATYTFPVDPPLDTVIAELVETYRRIWTPERRARADAIGMSEREIVTLASIIEKEARRTDEMPVISSVFHNRLRIGLPLQADPTVQYALGVHRERLLYAAIDSAADNPYNTYRHPGLPPGPIASPSVRAIDAALAPDTTDYLYFVARPDGSHIFTRSLDEHNRAKAAIRRERQNGGGSTAGRSGGS